MKSQKSSSSPNFLYEVYPFTQLFPKNQNEIPKEFIFSKHSLSRTAMKKTKKVEPRMLKKLCFLHKLIWIHNYGVVTYYRTESLQTQFKNYWFPHKLGFDLNQMASFKKNYQFIYGRLWLNWWFNVYLWWDILWTNETHIFPIYVFVICVF